MESQYSNPLKCHFWHSKFSKFQLPGCQGCIWVEHLEILLGDSIRRIFNSPEVLWISAKIKRLQKKKERNYLNPMCHSHGHMELDTNEKNPWVDIWSMNCCQIDENIARWIHFVPSFTNCKQLEHSSNNYYILMFKGAWKTESTLNGTPFFFHFLSK